MKRIDVFTTSGMQLAEVVAIDNRPIMVGDYVLRKEVWETLGPDGRYEYEKSRNKALFDRLDNKVERYYSDYQAWAIGQRNEKIQENCIAIRFIDEKLNKYYGVKIC
jgi:hypothetical protein